MLFRRTRRPNSARLMLQHRRVLWQVTRNDLAARYAGSLLGSAWVLLSPLLLLGVYAVVYLFVFRVRVPGLTPAVYVLYMFAGLVPYLATAEALAVGVGSVVANRAVLNSTVFPIDLVPAKAVLSSQATIIAGLAVVLIGSLLAGRLSWTVMLVPVLALLHALGVLGVVWILSLLNVVFRDLQNLISVALMLLMIASPIAYTPAMVPQSLKLILFLNPFAHLLNAYQKLLVLGELPSPAHAFGLVIVSLSLFLVGGWFFAGAKRAIADYV
jgi:homopolymeric O-antigen transport system permease protein